LGLVQELQRIVPAWRNLGSILAQEIFGIHVERAGEVLGRTNGLYEESRPALQVDLVKSSVEMLQFYRPVFFVHGDYFEETTLGMPVPTSDQRIFDSHIVSSWRL